MVMDIVRHCYKTRMRLWRDSDELTPVYWFRADPDAKVFGKMCSFRSSYTWTRHDEFTPKVGEIYKEHHRYYKGQNPELYKGLKHCGTDAAMQSGGIHGRDAEIHTDVHGNNPCCKTPPLEEVCILVGSTSNVARLPGMLRLEVVDRGTCPVFGGVDVPCVRSGFTPYNDPTDPGFGNFCTASGCYLIWATDDVYVPDGFGGQYFLRVAVGFRGHGEDAPPGCGAAACTSGFFYCKMGTVSFPSGFRSVTLQSCAGLNDVEYITTNPFRLEWHRDQNIGISGACVLGSGGSPSSSLLFRLTVPS